jgi:hypothetical protein
MSTMAVDVMLSGAKHPGAGAALRGRHSAPPARKGPSLTLGVTA